MRVRLGDLTGTDALAEQVAHNDGVVHAAFTHDFFKYREDAEIDWRALTAMVGALSGSDKPLIATSVVPMLMPGRLGVQTDQISPDFTRTASETAMRLSAARRSPSLFRPRPR